MAASTSLNVVINAQDNASSVIGGFNSSLESSKASILALGAIAATVFAAVSSEIVDATKAASNHQNQEAQLAQVIQSTGGAAGVTVNQINALAASLEQTTGYSRDTITQIDTLLVGFKDIGASVLPQATQAILDFATRMGTDPVEAATMLGKALANPKDAVGALTREHVVLSQAQQDAIKNFDAVGDTAGAQGVIIAALEQTFGGAAEQTQTMAFQQRLLQSQVEDLQVSIGTALLPVITSLMAKVEPLITDIVKWTEAHPELAKDILLVTAGVSGLIVVLTALAGVVLLVNVVMSPVTLIILAIVAAIALFVAAAIAIYDNWGAISSFFGTLWKEIEKVFQDSINAIVGFFQPLLDMVNSVVNAISKVASGIGAAASAAGHAVSSTVSSVIPHATGGGVVPSQTYLVGENGPELFSSNVGGTITPNNALGGSGGVTVVVNGGNYLDEQAAQFFGNMLAKTINRNLKLRTV